MGYVQAQILEGFDREKRVVRVGLQVAQFDLDIVFWLLKIAASKSLACAIVVGSS